jgi:hypothetical protein
MISKMMGKSNKFCVIYCKEIEEMRRKEMKEMKGMKKMKEMKEMKRMKEMNMNHWSCLKTIENDLWDLSQWKRNETKKHYKRFPLIGNAYSVINYELRITKGRYETLLFVIRNSYFEINTVILL